MHAQRGLQYLVCHSFHPPVCLSVCPVPLILALRAARWPKSDTNGFSATLALIFEVAIFVKVLRSKVMAGKPSEQANILMSMAQILPVSSMVEAVEVTRRASIWSWLAKNTTYCEVLFTHLYLLLCNHHVITPRGHVTSQR